MSKYSNFDQWSETSRTYSGAEIFLKQDIFCYIFSSLDRMMLIFHRHRMVLIFHGVKIPIAFIAARMKIFKNR